MGDREKTPWERLRRVHAKIMSHLDELPDHEAVDDEWVEFLADHPELDELDQ